MTRERWKMIKKVFRKAAEMKDRSKRAAYLKRACDGEDTFRQDVESLLAQHENPEPFMGVLSSMGGKTILHYEVLERIGEGGMGIVYKAHDTRLDRLVVLKVLPAWLMADPKAKALLTREAKCASGLNHPNIVTVHGIEQVNGVDFIVMEYVAGKTLDRLIPPNGIAVYEAVGYARQIAAALAKAHAARVIHRDLKPSNIMVTVEGHAKVLDFGLAGVLEPDNSGPGGQRHKSHEILLGTLSYMSPEQAAGLAVDLRSDIFSFGVVLYEMITGTRPFPSRPSGAAISDDPPSPMPGGLPEALRDLVFRCLAKEPEHRFQTIQTVLLELDALSAAHSANRKPLAPESVPVRRASLVVTAVILMAFVIAGVYLIAARGRTFVNGPFRAILSAATVAFASAAESNESAYNRAVRLMREQKYGESPLG